MQNDKCKMKNDSKPVFRVGELAIFDHLREPDSGVFWVKPPILV
jgi:hypothetical protein